MLRDVGRVALSRVSGVTPRSPVALAALAPLAALVALAPFVNARIRANAARQKECRNNKKHDKQADVT